MIIVYSYNFTETQKFDWKILIIDQYILNFGQLDLYFCIIN